MMVFKIQFIELRSVIQRYCVYSAEFLQAHLPQVTFSSLCTFIKQYNPECTQSKMFSH